MFKVTDLGALGYLMNRVWLLRSHELRTLSGGELPGGYPTQGLVGVPTPGERKQFKRYVRYSWGNYLPEIP